jgi:carbohydrate-selective porin OprB
MTTDLGVRNDQASGAGFCADSFWCWPLVLLCLASFLSSARCAEMLASSEVSSGDKALAAITGNPAAENQLPGTGLAGRLLHLPEDSGLRLGGLWLADTNGLLSGGAQPGKWSWNSALIIGANLDAEKLLNWKGASFGVQFLQFNGQDTNGQAGSVQGYNSLPGPKPLNRSELYQLWYRQTLFDDKIVFRIGKMVPTIQVNSVRVYGIRPACCTDHLGSRKTAPAESTCSAVNVFGAVRREVLRLASALSRPVRSRKKPLFQPLCNFG